MTRDELAPVWRACGELDAPYGAIIQLLILTGQRRSEVAEMAWDELDLDTGLWRLPRERTKNGRPHELPLSESAVEILRRLPRRGDGLVFGARRAPDNFSPIKIKLDERSGVRGWTLHDLRRTATSGMAALGIAPHVIERIHVSGTFSGVAGIYNRHRYGDEMRQALEIWGASCARLGEENVVELSRGAKSV